MNARIAPIIILLSCLASGPAAAQGYAGLGTDVQGYAVVSPENRISFPQDHGPHPGYRIEWWYVTANLQDEAGNDYGIQWTLFRQALAPAADGEGAGWGEPQLWMGHAGLTSADAHLSAERFARGGIRQAGVEMAPFNAFIDEWQMRETDGGPADLSDLSLRASAPDFSYELTLRTDREPVLQGDEGYSVKSEAGQASHYYSQPFYDAEGTLTLDGRSVAVSGRAWLDREWSSQPLAADQEGWDWFSLHLPEGRKLMVYRLRDEDGSAYVPGKLIEADGRSKEIPPNEIDLEPLEWTAVAGRDVPTSWRIVIESNAIDIRTRPLNAESWMDTTFAYWEGPIRFTGSHEGVGYLEMTGYGDGDAPRTAAGVR